MDGTDHKVMQARQGFDSVDLRSGGTRFVLAPSDSWGIRAAGKLSGLEGAQVFESLWLDRAGVGDLFAFWDRQRENVVSPPNAARSELELRAEISASIRNGRLALAAPHADGADGRLQAMTPPWVATSAGVNAAQLRAIMPNARDVNISDAVDALCDAMAAHGIDTNPRRAAFLAQIAVESQALRHLEEGLRYTHADRIRAVFGRALFPTLESAKSYVNDPKKLANYVYGAKNGNKGGTDGWDFRGRGYIQLTGRTNYRAAGYETDPDALLKPKGAADASALYWEQNGLNRLSATWLKRAAFDEVTGRGWKPTAGGRPISARRRL